MAVLIRNITVFDVYMVNVRKGIKISADVGDHPDTNYNPKALPVVKHMRINNVRVKQWKIHKPASQNQILNGISGALGVKTLEAIAQLD
ncbi:hypothetical protein L1887_01304 [Cichorium endivia]|nr:hypothetical protein L1887_01304 [Cichorium endivia]